MATKKTSKKSGLMLGIAAIVGGAIGDAVAGFVPVSNNKIKAAIPAGLGLALSSQDNEMLKGLGMGMAGSGGALLKKAFLPSSGVTGYDDVYVGDIFVNEPSDVTVGDASI